MPGASSGTSAASQAASVSAAAASATEAERYALAQGWLEGDPSGLLRPDAPLSRAELAAVALRVAAVAPPVSLGCFDDVPRDAWYAAEVCRAAALGWMGGFPDGSFRPDEPVSAAAGLKVLLSAQGFAPAPEPEPLEIEPWYANYLSAARALGLASVPDDALEPLSRADLSALLLGLERVRARSSGAALPSSGCGLARPALASLESGGLGRDLLVRLPETYDPERPLPLVLAFHGRTNSSAEVARYYGLEDAGAEAIYVYPAGVPVAGGYSWTPDGDGLAFFDALLNTLTGTYCTDLGRIFAVGHSLGASYVNALGCARGEVLRGVAAVAGGRPYGACRGKTAALLVHNPEDGLVPFDEGLAARDSFLAQNDLGGPGVPSEPSFLSCERYGGADAPFPVVWCPHDIDEGPGGRRYPHTWPEGTGDAVMAFFARLP